MEKIYKLKETVTMEDLKKRRYVEVPGDTGVIAKIIKQPLNGDLAKTMTEGLYGNPKWVKQFYDQNKKQFKEILGLKYDKSGNIVMTKKFKSIITDWLVEADFLEDRWLGFRSADPFDSRIFYNVSVLNKYCEQEIKELKEAELIEEIEVEG